MYNTVRNQEIDTHKLLEVVVIRPEAQVLLVVEGLMVVPAIEEGWVRKGVTLSIRQCSGHPSLRRFLVPLDGLKDGYGGQTEALMELVQS